MAVRTSNDEFFTVLPELPVEGVGWEIDVVSPADYASKVMTLGEWSNMSFQDALSDPGSGLLDLPSHHPLLSRSVPGSTGTVLDNICLMRVKYENQVVHEWLLEDVDEPVADEDIIVKVNGRGTAAVLDLAVALPANYPVGLTDPRKFTTTPKMAAWRTLFLEAQARGNFPQVTLLFNATTSSDGEPWTDAETFDVTAGDSLLDLLSQWCSAHNFTWRMFPGWKLGVFKSYGDIRDNVIYSIGSHQQKHRRKRSRKDLFNYIYSGAADGVVATSADGPGIAKWGRRETWVDAGDTESISGAQWYGDANLRQFKDENPSRDYVVDFTANGRRIYSDWFLGDKVMLETAKGQKELIRPVTITVGVDAQRTVTTEITIADEHEPPQPPIVKMKKKQETKQGGKKTPSKASSKKNPATVTQQTLAVSSINALQDVDANTANVGDALVFDGSNWVDVPFKLDYLLDVEAGGPADGDLLSWDAGTSRWVNSSPSLVSGGIPWQKDVDNALTSTANLTLNGGSMSVVSGQVQLANSGFSRAVSTTPIQNTGMVIVECELDIQTTSSNIAQIILSTSAAASGGIAWRMDSRTSVRFERDGSSNLGSVSYTMAIGWRKFRMVIMGNTLIGYIDGTRVLTVVTGDAFPTNMIYPGIGISGAQTRFRNLKAWGLAPTSFPA